jgi:hypothetical protein
MQDLPLPARIKPAESLEQQIPFVVRLFRRIGHKKLRDDAIPASPNG